MNTEKKNVVIQYYFHNDVIALIRYLVTMNIHFNYNAAKKVTIYCTIPEAKLIVKGAKMFGAESEPYCEIL